MNSGALLALTLFTTGAILLLLWLVRAFGNPRAAILLRKSVVFFLLPGALMVVIPIVGRWFPMNPTSFFGTMLLAVAIEEFLKMSAARSEALPRDKFALVLLFGLYELALAKPIGPLVAGWAMGGLTTMQVVTFTFAGVLAVLMHSVTAALYAGRFARQPWLALLVCFVFHALYNALMITFFNGWLVLLVGIGLGVVLALNWPDRDLPEEWDWAEAEDAPAA